MTSTHLPYGPYPCDCPICEPRNAVGGPNPCPACGALPCDWANDPRKASTPPTPATDEREAVARAVSTKTYALIGSSDDCGEWHEMSDRARDVYRTAADAALSALAPIRAAEILAAEANERARALGQATEHINRLEAALRGLLSTVERLDISEGVCCCGDDMATHAEPMSCGHTPVDAGHYHHGNAIQQARDAIEHGAGK